LKINSIHIEGVAGIWDLKIPFHPRMNILCGPNAIGKTTVLECVAHCFSVGESNVLKRHFAAESSRIQATLAHGDARHAVDIKFDQYEANKPAQIHGRYEQCAFLLSLKTTRTFAYKSLDAVGKDTEKPAHVIRGEAMNGISLADVKNWFVNRYLYSKHLEALSDEQLENFALAKECFSALNKDFAFSNVNASSNEILVTTPTGEVYYEYLSSGFKSCLAIIFGIIKEIEFRFPKTKAKDFDGVVLIDEVELHLHPEWQYRIANVLTTIFPKVQFIVTTHSPHVIQSAEPNQILALESHSGKVKLRDLPKSAYGFKGWTLDEVLTDVMGMKDTRTETYNKLMDQFSAAIDREDHAAAKQAYEQLALSLHPSSHVPKLLRLQLASIVGVS
jgi:predicted ATP-dependent endonuclease of OLD family